MLLTNRPLKRKYSKYCHRIMLFLFYSLLLNKCGMMCLLFFIPEKLTFIHTLLIGISRSYLEREKKEVNVTKLTQKAMPRIGIS